MRYFHGGPAGIWPSRILPPEVTGAESLAKYNMAGLCRTDRIYVTTSLDAALMYAALAPSAHASVYEVEPEGELEPDPDCDHVGLSYQCRAARIVREVAVPEVLRTMVYEAIR